MYSPIHSLPARAHPPSAGLARRAPKPHIPMALRRQLYPPPHGMLSKLTWLQMRACWVHLCRTSQPSRAFACNRDLLQQHNTPWSAGGACTHLLPLQQLVRLLHLKVRPPLGDGDRHSRLGHKGRRLGCCGVARLYRRPGTILSRCACFWRRSRQLWIIPWRPCTHKGHEGLRRELSCMSTSVSTSGAGPNSAHHAGFAVCEGCSLFETAASDVELGCCAGGVAAAACCCFHAFSFSSRARFLSCSLSAADGGGDRLATRGIIAMFRSSSSRAFGRWRASDE